MQPEERKGRQEDSCAEFTHTTKINEVLFELERLTPDQKLSSYVIHASQLRKYIQRNDDVVDDLVDATFVARENVEVRDVSDETDAASEVEFEEMILPPILSPHGNDERTEVPLEPEQPEK